MASLGCRVGRLLPTLHRLSRQTITVARYRVARMHRFTCRMSSYMECGEKYNVENRKMGGTEYLLPFNIKAAGNNIKWVRGP